jgi:hypothetical protein
MGMRGKNRAAVLGHPVVYQRGLCFLYPSKASRVDEYARTSIAILISKNATDTKASLTRFWRKCASLSIKDAVFAVSGLTSSKVPGL